MDAATPTTNISTPARYIRALLMGWGSSGGLQEAFGLGAGPGVGRQHVVEGEIGRCRAYVGPPHEVRVEHRRDGVDDPGEGEAAVAEGPDAHLVRRVVDRGGRATATPGRTGQPHRR